MRKAPSPGKGCEMLAELGKGDCPKLSSYAAIPGKPAGLWVQVCPHEICPFSLLFRIKASCKPLSFVSDTEMLGDNLSLHFLRMIFFTPFLVDVEEIEVWVCLHHTTRGGTQARQEGSDCTVPTSRCPCVAPEDYRVFQTAKKIDGVA